MTNNIRFDFAALRVLALLLVIAPVALAQRTISWSAQADSFRGQNGRQFTFICPPNGTASSRLWGSGPYTDDSSICTAAVHAGVINVVSGGNVTIEIQRGSTSYAASSRHGVNSRSYGAWSGSFIVVGGQHAGNQANRITWSTQANSLRGRNGERFTFVCPANGTASSRLWGSGLYTDDSSICTAAVHAGVINVVSGGTVTIEIRAGAGSYRATYSNGVNSRSYGSWTGSFVIVGGRTDQQNQGACSNLIGVWEGLSGDSQFREVIYITRGANGLGVWGEWFDRRTGAKRGAFSSSNYRCQSDHLFFHQSYTPKPDPRWAPDNDIELWTDGTTLFIKHRYGKSSIKRRN